MAELTGEALGAATVAPVKAVKGGAMAAATAQQQAQEPEQVVIELLCALIWRILIVCSHFCIPLGGRSRGKLSTTRAYGSIASTVGSLFD